MNWKFWTWKIFTWEEPKRTDPIKIDKLTRDEASAAENALPLIYKMVNVRKAALVIKLGSGDTITTKYQSGHVKRVSYKGDCWGNDPYGWFRDGADLKDAESLLPEISFRHNKSVEVDGFEINIDRIEFVRKKLRTHWVKVGLNQQEWNDFEWREHEKIKEIKKK